MEIRYSARGSCSGNRSSNRGDTRSRSSNWSSNRGGRRTAAWIAPLLSVMIGLLAAMLLTSGCHNNVRGDPVSRFQYEHTITVSPDRSHFSVQTYINRTQWRVGSRREDLYDGNRDGTLTTPGMDRVAITDYIDIEDPPENAVRRSGDIRDYDELFQTLLAAVNSDEKSVKIEDRSYEFRFL